MKKFKLSKNYAIINFDSVNCNSGSEILQSRSFSLVIRRYIRQLKLDNSIFISKFEYLSTNDLVDFYKLLFVYSLEEAVLAHKVFNREDIYLLYEFTEGLYDFWRKLERFGLVKSSKNYSPSTKVSDLIAISNDFNKIIITLYRSISQKLLGSAYSVYRQLPAGINSNLLYIRHRFKANEDYEIIQNIPFIVRTATTTPFIIKSKSNTRSGLFTEIDYNPISKINMNPNDFIAFPILVGSLLAFVYIHNDFLHHGIALTNLFEFAKYNSFKKMKPDLIFIYGIEEDKYDLNYYNDELNETLVGFVTRNDKNDYFGYLKKMLLTLHNVSMIKKGNLPIHGAMVNVKLKNDETKNVVIIGDSGAGKSETLEGLRVVGEGIIKKMDIVFDDMGLFKYGRNNVVVSNGTETGAFVRLDDLDASYVYEVMDRAIFLNPHQINARVVIPISSYNLINLDHKVDILLYANNYDEKREGITLFDNIDDAIKTFEKGVRKAKGTTSEVGLVETYFANPFGPVQLKEETEKLVRKYFNSLKDNNVIVGEIYTKLAIDGMESRGPQEAAKSLLELIKRITNL